jgi:hypothetical protein
LSVGSGLLLAAGFFVGVVLRSVLVGVFLFALGAILFAFRGYLNTGEKAVAGALIFVSVVAMGIEAIVYLLGAIAAAPLWVANYLYLFIYQHPPRW